MRFANRENLIRSWGHGAHPLQSIKISTRLAGLLVGLILLSGTVQVKTVGSSEPQFSRTNHPRSGTMRLDQRLPTFRIKNMCLRAVPGCWIQSSRIKYLQTARMEGYWAGCGHTARRRQNVGASRERSRALGDSFRVSVASQREDADRKREEGASGSNGSS